MNRRVRLLAFLAAAAVVAAVVVAITLGGGGEGDPAPERAGPAGEPSPRRAAPRPKPQLSRPPPAVKGRGAERRLRAEGQAPLAQLREEQPRVDAAARGFLEGFLAIDVGDRGERALRALRAHAEPELVGFLLADRPRLPPGIERPARGEVLALEGEFDKPPTAYRARVVVDHDGEPTELGLELRRRGSKWIVVEVTE